MPKSLGLLGEAVAAEASGFTFLQISDSHVGFNKPANPDALGTLREAIGKVKALTAKPAFMIHTGDITHLSKPDEFDNADQGDRRQASTCTTFPASTTSSTRAWARPISTATARAPRGRAGTASTITASTSSVWSTSSTSRQVGSAGSEPTSSLGLPTTSTARPARHRSSSSRIFRCGRFTPIGAGAPTTALQALELLKRFGSVTVLNGHIHQIVQKVEGNMTFHTARSTAFPQPAPGTAPAPGPMTVPAEQLRSMLGITSVEVRMGNKPLAVTDTTLAG